MNVHFSSQRNDWATPQSVYEELNAEFGFCLDVCAWDWNTKAAVWLTPFDDALSLDWTWIMRELLNSKPTAWMNPPYGREIGKWMRKAYEESKRGSRIVCLVPARTDTAWWHNYATKGIVRFIRGRIKFDGHKSGAPFPSAIVVFG